jgi:hypothetical protein
VDDGRRRTDDGGRRKDKLEFRIENLELPSVEDRGVCVDDG